jgi:hypothetical protein
MEPVIADAAPLPFHDRYGGPVRSTVAVLSGIIAGVLTASSIQVGVAFGTLGHNATDWTLLQWGDHWMWRAAASLAATMAGAFPAGMIARRHGQTIGILSAVPATLYWAFVAVSGWLGHIPATTTPVEVPLGYRIVATVLTLVILPVAASGGREGAAFGRANAEHYDSRRRAILGVRWYHFLWLPFLIHAMAMTAAFGAVYGFGWVVTAWKNSFSILGMIPIIFTMALLGTLNLLGTGASRTYQALAGFDESAPVARQVMKFGVGYTLLTILAQGAIAAVHFGVSALARKIFG